MNDSMQVDRERAVRIAHKIQDKYFNGRLNGEVMVICCILLADEIADAEVADRYGLLDGMVKIIKQFVAMTEAKEKLQ